MAGRRIPFVPGPPLPLAALLRGVARAAGPARRSPAMRRALLVHARPNAWTFALLTPLWLDEALGSRLPRATLRDLLEVQACVLAFAKVHDDLLDGAGGAGGLAAVLPLLFEAQRRLARLFAPRDPFWRDFRALVHAQVAADRWEERGRPARRLDSALLAALGDKAALLRWPASAVARLAGAPRRVPRLEWMLRRLYTALQLLDDLADVEEDARDGQANAVLAAGGGPGSDDLERDIAVLRGAPRVASRARREIEEVRAAVPEGSQFAAAASSIAGCCDRYRERAIAAARLRLAAAMCAALAA
jgi:hypothetical protein